MKKAIIAIALISLAIISYILLAGKGTDERITEPVPKRFVAAEGKVEALAGLDVEVGSDLTGRIERFFVKEGDWVEKGRQIARLENREIRAKLKEAEGELAVARAKLKEVASGSREEEIKRATAAEEGAIANMVLARKELERHEELYKKGLISESDLDDRRRVLQVAQARLKEAEEEKRLLEKGPKKETLRLHENTITQTQATVEYHKGLLEKTIITAPISGKVIHKYLDEGEIVNPEIPLVAIADIEKIRVNAEVDETDVGRIQIGDPVEVTSYTYPGRLFKGKIEEIADYVGIRRIKPNNPAVNLGMKVVQVKIELLEKTPLKLGMTVDVRIKPKEERNP